MKLKYLLNIVFVIALMFSFGCGVKQSEVDYSQFEPPSYYKIVTDKYVVPLTPVAEFVSENIFGSAPGNWIPNSQYYVYEALYYDIEVEESQGIRFYFSKENFSVRPRLVKVLTDNGDEIDINSIDEFFLENVLYQYSK